MSKTDAMPDLSWELQDIERKLGIPGAKYTGTNSFLTAGVAILLSVAYYGTLAAFPGLPVSGMFIKDTAVKTSIPAAIVFLSSWCLAILVIKWFKLRLQRRALQFSVVPDDPAFVLSPRTASEVLSAIRLIADQPRKFLLFNRIESALANLQNIGRVSDIDDILRSQSDIDEDYIESTYTILRGFVWAIPVFGFIGTVLGLSVAMGDFGKVLAQEGAELNQVLGSLRLVTGGLNLAFETTLIGLVAAVAIQLVATALKRQEELFLDECREYCHRHIVSRLRTIRVAEDAQVEGAP